jgi:hypothetical protein
MPSRVEHLAAGGESAGFDRERLPGRAVMGEREVQIAWVDEAGSASSGGATPLSWEPTARLTAVVTAGPHAVARALQEAHPGCEVVVAPTVPSDSARPAIVVADSDTWQRSWQLWQQVRAQGEVLIRAENPADLRQLAGVRETPPFARLHAGRVWSLRGDGPPRRAVLSALTPR